MSASSSTRSGRMDTARHRKRRWACSRFSLSMPNNVCSYVSSKLSGKSFKMPRILAGKQRRSLSSWHTIQRNLSHHVGIQFRRVKGSNGLHAVGLFRERIDNQLLIFLSPLPHFLVFADDSIDVVNYILLLSNFIVEGESETGQRLQ